MEGVWKGGVTLPAGVGAVLSCKRVEWLAPEGRQRIVWAVPCACVFAQSG